MSSIARGITPGVPERAIQASIVQYLRMRSYYVQRLNSGALRDEDGRMVRLAATGTPDILVIRDGHAVFIEVKRPGNKPTAHQLARMEELRAHGATCLVATSVDDVIAAGL